MANDDDLELFHRWAGGDLDAGQQLVVRHYDSVCSFFASKLADHAAMKLTEDTFEAVCTKAASLQLHASFASYLFGIARLKLVAHYREQVGHGFEPLVDTCPAPGPGASVTALLERQPEVSRWVGALRQLPLDDQILLELRLSEGLQLREIAEILGASKERVASRLAAARQRLQHTADGAAVEPALTSLTSTMREIRAALTRRPGAVDRDGVEHQEAERVEER
jgi:RNA polymerase sigma factor (sigma-70 family)